jgi:hypothetical protein
VDYEINLHLKELFIKRSVHDGSRLSTQPILRLGKAGDMACFPSLSIGQESYTSLFSRKYNVLTTEVVVVKFSVYTVERLVY